ncbi:MAG: substrate-binding periplasmic protein [Thermodesulfobacteriota bacterium]
MLRWLAVISILSPALLFGVCRSDADDIIAVTEVWPPFRIQEERDPDRLTGIDIDLLARIGAELGVTITVKRLPWARCLDFMKSGRADIITGLAYTEDRARYIRFSRQPYYTVAPAFFVRKGSGAVIRNYDDLYRFTIGYSIDSAYFEPFNSDKKLRKVGVSTERQLIEMLHQGHLPVIIGTDCNVEYDAARLGVGSAIEKAPYRPEQTTDLYIGISKKSAFLKQGDHMERFVEKLVKTGVVKKLTTRYLLQRE